MSYTFNRYLLVLFVTFLLCMKTSSSSSESLSKDHIMKRCIKRERKALLLFKQGVVCDAGGDYFLHSWKNEDADCCKWEGVGCDNHTGHVTRLHLSSLISPCSVYYTSVCISHSFLDLPYLKYLDISQNCFAEFPRFIGSLTKLVHLDISDNLISGSIPYQIKNLTYLQYLNFGNNYFDGSIPKFIGSLSSLRYLDLSQSYYISGVIPHELGNLSKLQHLDLGYTRLAAGLNSGWYFNLSSLTYLDLSETIIAPPSIWVSVLQRIPSISVMHLSYCDLSAPSSSSNFPSSISRLHLGGNNINSSIFNWLPHFSVSMVELDLGHNLLKGKIPESLGHMTALTYLNVTRNQLNGVLPISIRHLTNLQVIDFSANNFMGNLDIRHLTNLQVIDFSANNFTGKLDIRHLTNLQVIDFSANNFTGNLDIYHLTKLQVVDFSANSFMGNLDIRHLTNLQVINVRANNFIGNLKDVLSGPFPLLKEFLGCVHLDGME